MEDYSRRPVQGILTALLFVLCSALMLSGVHAQTPEIETKKQQVQKLERELTELDAQLATVQDSLRQARTAQSQAQEAARKTSKARTETSRKFSEFAAEVNRNLDSVKEFRRSIGDAAYFREVLGNYGLGLVEAGKLDQSVIDRLDSKQKQQLWKDLGQSGSVSDELLLVELRRGSLGNTIPFAQALANIGGLIIKMIPAPSHPASTAMQLVVDVVLSEYANSLGLGGEDPRLKKLQSLNTSWSDEFQELTERVRIDGDKMQEKIDALPKGEEWNARDHNQRISLFDNESKQFQESLARLHADILQKKEEIDAQIEPLVRELNAEADKRSKAVGKWAQAETALSTDIAAKSRQISSLHGQIYNLTSRYFAEAEASAFTAEAGEKGILEITGIEYIVPSLRERPLRNSLYDREAASLYGLPVGMDIQGVSVSQIKFIPRAEIVKDYKEVNGEMKEISRVEKYYIVESAPSQIVRPRVSATPSGVVSATGREFRVIGPGEATVTLSVNGLLQPPSGRGQRITPEEYRALPRGTFKKEIELVAHTLEFKAVNTQQNSVPIDEQPPTRSVETFYDAGRTGVLRIEPLILLRGAGGENWRAPPFSIPSREYTYQGRVVSQARNLPPSWQMTSDDRSETCRIEADRPGSSGLSISLQGDRGNTIASQNISVSFNAVRFQPASEEFLKGEGDQQIFAIPTGEPVELVVSVAGDTRMSQYYCEWEVQATNPNQQVELGGSQTRFARSGGVWKAVNTIYSPSLDTNRKFGLSRNLSLHVKILPVSPRPGERDGYEIYQPAQLYPPRCERLVLRAERNSSTALVPVLDLFYPGGSHSRIDIEALAVDRTGKEREITGFSSLTFSRRGDQEVFFHGPFFVSPKAAPGQLTLAAALARDANGVFFLRNGRERIVSQNQLEFTNNVMELQSTRSGYRLTVTGPADMNEYRAIWTFASGEQLEGQFTLQGPESWICLQERPAFDCSGVVLQTLEGDAVAEYEGHIPRPQGASAVRDALIALFTAYEREDIGAFLAYVSPDFRSMDDSGRSYGIAQLQIALADDFRNLEAIEFGVDTNPPLGGTGAIRLETRWNRRATLAVSGQEWVLKDRKTILLLRYDADQSRYLLTSIQGDPIFGLSTPTGEITIPAGSVVEGVQVASSSSISEGMLGDGATGGTGFGACVGSIPFKIWILESDPTFILYFAGIDIDPYTGACFLRNDGQGQALIFQTPTDAGGYALGEVVSAFPDRLVSNWEFTPPSSPGGPGVVEEIRPGEERALYLRSAEVGITIKIVVKITGSGENLVLNVIEISEVK